MQITLMLVLSALLVAGEGVVLYLLFRGQQRVASNYNELAHHLETIHALVSNLSTALGNAQPAPALPIGTQAPTFALPDLAGRERKLDEFLGRPLLLTFFSTSCGFCQEMAPRFGEVPEGAPSILLVSRGDVDEHLQMAAENKWRCDVVLESGTEVMNSYKAYGTPTGYLIDADGRIASDLAVGADAVFALIASPTRGAAEDLTAETLRKKEVAAVQQARDAGLAIRPSTVQRDGLPAGTRAPDFTLPDLQGEERRLAEFRDRRVLLVFSDPECGPCEVLATDLVRLQQSHSRNNLQVVMISRGDPAENERKAKQQGFNFPVLLQKRWEVSKEYAMFATPVGYLIDTEGIIAKDVAVGKSAILSLV
jgi:peroxiredoxin